MSFGRGIYATHSGFASRRVKNSPDRNTPAESPIPESRQSPQQNTTEARRSAEDRMRITDLRPVLRARDRRRPPRPIGQRRVAQRHRVRVGIDVPDQQVPIPDIGLDSAKSTGFPYLNVTGHYTPVGNPSVIVFLDLSNAE
jgi:hypothetical protein